MQGADWADKLNLAAEDIPAPTKKVYISYFAEFLRDNGFAKGFSLHDLDIAAQQGEVSANLLTCHEADEIIERLKRADHFVTKLACFLFCLGFYAGLRRGEIEGLQFTDLIFNHDVRYVNLHIRPNFYRELKSPSSRRNLPLDALFPKEELLAFKHFVEQSKTIHTREGHRLFWDKSTLNEAFTLLTKTMHQVTGDEQLRFHHCRHSFANWSWIRLHTLKDRFEDIQITKKAKLHFLYHDYFSLKQCERLQARLGIAPFSRKKAWALAEMLGHSTPKTTLSSYFHLVAWMRREGFANHPPSSSLMKRAKEKIHWQPALSRINETNPLPEKYQQDIKTEQQDDEIPLSMLTSKTPLPLTLNRLWHVIQYRSDEVNETEIAQRVNVKLQTIKQALELDKTQSAQFFRKSSHQLPPLVHCPHLRGGNIKLIENLIARFEDAEKAHPNWHHQISALGPLLQDMVGAKSGLIRTKNTFGIRAFLWLLKRMNEPEESLSLRWYYPHQGMSAEQYQEDLNFWRALIQQTGFNPNRLKILVPHAQKENVPSTKSTVIYSDEGKYLAYRQKGYVSVHWLQPHSMLEKNKAAPAFSFPRRSKVFIHFLRLVVIYNTMKMNQTQPC